MLKGLQPGMEFRPESWVLLLLRGVIIITDA